MKKLGVLLLLIVIFFSPVVSILGTTSVYAITNMGSQNSKEMIQVFPSIAGDLVNTDDNGITGYLLPTGTAKIQPGTTSTGSPWIATANSMKFTVTLNLREQGIDIPKDSSQNGENKGKVDILDNIGDWDTIFDTDMENSEENGVFLFINKVNSVDTPPEPGTVYQQVNTTPVNFTVYQKDGKPDTIQKNEEMFSIFTKVSTNPLLYKSMKVGKQNAQNIGHFILRDNPTNIFFDQHGINFSVAITGLEADTTYTYGILLVEDGGNTFAYTNNGVTFDSSNTFRTLPAGSANPNGEAITASLETGGSQEGNTTGATNSIFGVEVDCDILPPGVDILGCALQLYYTLYQVASGILRMAAGFMDVFMAYSLSDYMYRNGFIETGWTVVRDVCNMLFIFILLWTAFKMVINDHHFNAKVVITNILIIGIFINFSLFFTKAVIDLGNISARVFYNQIRIQGTAQDDVAAAVDSGKLGIKPVAISEAIANGIGFGDLNATGYNKMTKSNAGPIGYGPLFLLITLGIVLNLCAAFILVKVSFAFLGRILSLWMAMVFAPFAFTSTILDGGGGKNPLDMEKIGWHAWLKNLLNAAFYPAIFLFFLFLITILIKDNFLKDAILANDNLTGVAWIVTFLLNAAFLLGLLKVAGDMGQKMSGTFGAEIASLAGKAAGFVGGAAIGVATGGASLALQRTVGARAANTLAGNEGSALRAASTGDFKGARANFKTDDEYNAFLKKHKMENEDEGARKRAQSKVQKLQSIASNSFDARQTKLGRGVSNATGLNFNNAGAKALGVNTEKTAGGYQAMVDRKAFKEAEYFKKIGASEDDIKRAKTGVDEAKKELEEKEKSTKAEIENKERENKDIVERAQAGASKPGDQATLNTNQDTIKNLRKGLKDAHDEAKATYPPGHAQAGQYVNPKSSLTGVALAKREELEAETILKDQTKSGLRKYQEYLKTHPPNRNNNSFTGFGLRKLMSGEFKGAANAFARDFKNALSGAWRGALVGSIIPGVGTMAGAIGGAIGGGVLSTLNNTVFANRLGKDVDHAIAAGHIHEPHTKAKYTTPNSSWFDQIFKGNMPSGGGGKDHGSGGSHGGGGHH